MVCLPESGFCPKVDRETVHLMVGSLVEVEVAARKVRWKIFRKWQGVLMKVEDFYNDGGIA